MNRFMFVVALLLVASLAFAQAPIAVYGDTFVPKTLSAGTSMTARTLSTTFADTTQTFVTRGLAACYLSLETATNDSMRILIGYRTTKDGTNFNAWVVFDSLVSTGTVGIFKTFTLPGVVLASYGTQIKVYGSAFDSPYSANPSATLTTKIIRVPYNREDVRVR